MKVKAINYFTNKLNGLYINRKLLVIKLKLIPTSVLEYGIP